MNKNSAAMLGIAMILGGANLAFSCSSDPSPPEGGGAGTGGAGGSPDGEAGGMTASGEGGVAPAGSGENGGGGLNEGGGQAQGGAEQGGAGSGGDESSVSGAGGDSGAGGNSGAGGSDVVGTVINGEGAVVASAKVEIAGQLVTTDALGRFTVHHVPDTYSAVIVFVPPPIGALPAQNTAEVYDELTTRSPLFRLQYYPDELPHQGEIGGSVSGGAGFPMPDGQGYKFGATARTSNGGSLAAFLLFPTTYAFPALFWAGEPGNEFTVGGLQWRAGPGGLPIGYDGWASHEVALPPLEPYSQATVDLVLAPIASRTVTGTITKPADCVVPVLGTVDGIVLFNDTPATSTYSYVMPEVLSGATTALTAACYWGSGPNYMGGSVSVGLEAGNSVNLPLPSPPSLTQPAHQAAGVTYSTSFSWAAGDHLLRRVKFVGGGWTIYRHGAGESSTLPDLTRFGISIPPSSSFTWQVLSFKVDAGAATTWDGILGISPYEAASTGHALFKAESQQWIFTLAP